MPEFFRGIAAVAHHAKHPLAANATVGRRTGGATFLARLAPRGTHRRGERFPPFCPARPGRGGGLCGQHQRSDALGARYHQHRGDLYLQSDSQRGDSLVPQGFSAGLLMDAYANAFTDGGDFTDDAGIVEAFGHKVSLVKGSEDNIKITTPEDVVLETRIGKVFDVHRLVEGRKLILGGVDIPYEKGLLGHSDADVLLHALIDAILGAASMGDIGRLFPDTDPAFKDASSLVLLERAWNAVKYRGYDFINADITVICERPKLAPHIDKMEDNICNVLNISRERINIKATTTEKLGFTGRGEGIAAEAVCILSCSPK